MRITLLRHAIAEDEHPEGDVARRLTPEGRQRFAECVQGMRALRFDFEEVVHSPWVRAVQTAEMLRGPRREEALLALPPGPELIASLKDGCVYVGHEPWLSTLVRLLSGARVEMKKGGIAVLEGDPRPGGMTLKALLPPKILRRLA